MRIMKLNKSELRSYLLTEPGSAGHEEVEAWLGEVEDEEFERLLGEVEDELIDAYVWDELSDDEIPGFESNFLSQARRRRKLSFSLSFARSLQERATRRPQESPRASEKERHGAVLFRLFPRPPVARPAWALAVAATLAAFMVGGVWMFVGNQRLERRLAELTSEQTALAEQAAAIQGKLSEERARGEETSAALQSERNLRSVLEQELETLRSAPRGGSTVTGALSAIASIWLSPSMLGATRGGGEMGRVFLPANAALVRLLLDVGSDEYESYRASLHDVEGDEVWSQAKLEAEALDGSVAVALTLPTSVLSQADYYIRLSGTTAAGDLELLGTYRFRALRE
jgi:hypothetical protein